MIPSCLVKPPTSGQAVEVGGRFRTDPTRTQLPVNSLSVSRQNVLQQTWNVFGSDLSPGHEAAVQVMSRWEGPAAGPAVRTAPTAGPAPPTGSDMNGSQQGLDKTHFTCERGGDLSRDPGLNVPVVTSDLYLQRLRLGFMSPVRA